MSEAGKRLSARREQLLLESAAGRQQISASLDGISGAADRVDHGLAFVRRVATPPVLVAGGVALAVLLRRGGVRRALAGGITLLGLVLRARSATAMVADLARGQAVRRSR